MRSIGRATFELVDIAAQVFADDTEASDRLAALARRLDEPLRVAVAGMTGAGKSTLVRAILQADLSVAGLGAWPQLVTAYRFGAVPRVRRVSASGASTEARLDRRGDQVVVVLSTSELADTERLEVEWPAPLLGSITLIDVPGIASLRAADSERATSFFSAGGPVPEFDALLYALRRLHSADVTFLQGVRDRAGDYGIVDTVAVLTRTDEIGAGRIDSLLSAREIAERYRADATLQSVASGIVPVAGLLAVAARTMTVGEFAALSALAGMESGARERLLVSADRFTRTADGIPVGRESRAALLHRFGLFGVRLSIMLLQAGVTRIGPLRDELAERSGIEELGALIQEGILGRAESLRARTAVLSVRGLLADRAPRDADSLWTALELLEAALHGMRELRLIADVRGGAVVVPPGTADEIERLAGGRGTDAASRLDAEPGASVAELRERALSAVERWRRMSADPLVDRAVVAVCETVVRSAEEIIATIPRSIDGRSGDRGPGDRGSGGRTVRLRAAPEEPVRAG